LRVVDLAYNDVAALIVCVLVAIFCIGINCLGSGGRAPRGNQGHRHGAQKETARKIGQRHSATSVDIEGQVTGCI
jgi:hypothetical protein